MVGSAPKQAAAHGTRMCWLLLTRPEQRSAPLDLSPLGMDCVWQPLLSTVTLPASATLGVQLRSAATLPRRVFVSAAAVDALSQLDPAQLRLPAAAVGPRTAEQLRTAGCASVWCANDTGIDALFGLPQWESLRDSPIALYCAAGGRMPDPNRLQALGLSIEPVHVYRRQSLRPSAALCRRLTEHWGTVVLSATSVALLNALDTVLSTLDLATARARPLLVLSARIAERAAELGYTQVATVDHLDVAEIRAALAVLEPSG